MEILQSTREKIVTRLTPTEGRDLDIMCNLTSQGQASIFLEELGYSTLGSRYIIERSNMLKRLTCAYQGRARSDLRDIGVVPDYANSSMGSGVTDL